LQFGAFSISFVVASRVNTADGKRRCFVRTNPDVARWNEKNSFVMSSLTLIRIIA